MCNTTFKYVWFMRHGKTEIDIESMEYEEFMEHLSNGMDVPLAHQHGIDCTELPKTIDLLCHSDYKRATQTAQIICDHIDVKAVMQLPSLREVKFDKQLIRKEEYKYLAGNRVDILNRWYDNQNWSESFDYSFNRAREIEAFIMTRPEKYILLISHGFFLRILELYFMQGKRTGISRAELLGIEPLLFGQFFYQRVKPSFESIECIS